MENSELNIVTGALGFTGKYITRQLLAMGKKVKTLTGHPDRQNPFGDKVDIAPFNFDNQRELIKSLQGAKTLYNTYWVRFSYGKTTFDLAVKNTKILIEAAEKAGIHRIVHLSITNASVESPLPYFRKKGIIENVIFKSGLSYAVIRPTIIFGFDDILINNIAWLLRRFPVFAVFGTGDHKVQPVYVKDVAEIALNAGNKKDNIIMDAVGPDIFTFNDMIRIIANKLHSKAKIIHLRPRLAFSLSRLVGYFVNDVLVSKYEVEGLMLNLLFSKGPPTGRTRLIDWIDKYADSVGVMYASELIRHYR